MDMVAESSGCKKWWLRCQNLNTTSASQSQKICGAVSSAWWHLSHPWLSTIPSLIRCSFKWQWPVSNTLLILSWFLLKLSNSPALVAEGLLRKALACLCPCLYSWSFWLFQFLIIPLATFVDMPQAVWSHKSRYEDMISCFISISPHVKWHPYQLPVSPGTDDSLRLI